MGIMHVTHPKRESENAGPSKSPYTIPSPVPSGSGLSQGVRTPKAVPQNDAATGEK